MRDGQSMRADLVGIAVMNVAVEAPSHPEQQNAAREHQTDACEDRGRQRRQHEPHDDGGGQTAEDNFAPIRLGNARRRKPNDDGVVARHGDIDQDHLDQRGQSRRYQVKAVQDVLFEE